MKKSAALFSALALFASAAHAEGFYIGGGFGAGDATPSSNIAFDVSDDRMYLVKGFGGFRVNKFIALEGSLVGVSNKDYYDDADGADANFSAVSASLLGIIPAADNFALYGKIGGYLGESNIDCSFWGACEDDEDESGMTWGAGFLMNFGQRQQFTIRLDYEEFDADYFDDLWAVSIGFQYNF